MTFRQTLRRYAGSEKAGWSEVPHPRVRFFLMQRLEKSCCARVATSDPRKPVCASSATWTLILATTTGDPGIELKGGLRALTAHEGREDRAMRGA